MGSSSTGQTLLRICHCAQYLWQHHQQGWRQHAQQPALLVPHSWKAASQTNESIRTSIWTACFGQGSPLARLRAKLWTVALGTTSARFFRLFPRAGAKWPGRWRRSNKKEEVARERHCCIYTPAQQVVTAFLLSLHVSYVRQSQDALLPPCTGLRDKQPPIATSCTLPDMKRKIFAAVCVVPCSFLTIPEDPKYGLFACIWVCTLSERPTMLFAVWPWFLHAFPTVDFPIDFR